MELHQLRGFVAVVDQASFSRAAQKVHVSQPALSMQVKTLEDELGERLLDRSPREVRPTDAGLAVYRRARQVLAAAQAVENDIAELRSLHRGHLSVACSDTLAQYVLAPALQAFGHRFPEVEVAVRNTTSRGAAELVSHMEADVGLVSLPEEAAGLSPESVLTFRDVAVVAEGHELSGSPGTTLAQLVGYRLLLLETGTRSRRFIDQALASRRIEATSVMELGSVNVQKSLASAGLGVAIVPDYALAPADRLHPLNIRELPPRHVGVIHRQSASLSRTASAFLGLLRDRLG